MQRHYSCKTCKREKKHLAFWRLWRTHFRQFRFERAHFEQQLWDRNVSSCNCQIITNLVNMWCELVAWTWADLKFNFIIWLYLLLKTWTVLYIYLRYFSFLANFNLFSNIRFSYPFLFHSSFSVALQGQCKGVQLCFGLLLFHFTLFHMYSYRSLMSILRHGDMVPMAFLTSVTPCSLFQPSIATLTSSSS